MLEELGSAFIVCPKLFFIYPVFDSLIPGFHVFFLDLLSHILVECLSVIYEKGHAGNDVGSWMAEIFSFYVHSCLIIWLGVKFEVESNCSLEL